LLELSPSTSYYFEVTKITGVKQLKKMVTIIEDLEEDQQS